MSDYLDKIQTQKKDGTPLATVPFRDSAAREDIITIQNELTTDTTTIEGNPLNFTTLSAQKSKSTIIDIEPIQDLHGYDKPWVGGAGKNLLKMTVQGIKTAYIPVSGTWSGNTFTSDNLKFTLITDFDDNITAIKYEITGTLSEQKYIYLDTFSGLSGNYLLSGGVSQNIYITLMINNSWSGKYSRNPSSDTELTINSSSDTIVAAVSVGSGSTGSGYFYPMIRLSTESDATFQPYTNIASISGKSEIGILGCGKNLFNLKLKETKQGSSVNLTPLDNGGFKINGTSSAANVIVWNTELENGGTHDTQNNCKKILPNGTYTISATGKSGLAIQVRGSNSESGSDDTGIASASTTDTTFTIDDTFKYNHIRIQFAKDVTFDNEIYYPMIRVSTDSSNYEPYTKSTDLTINLGQTVYGGTLDVENGVLVVDKGIVDLGDCSWVYNAGRFYTDSITNKKIPTSARTELMYCSCYQVISDGRSPLQAPNGSIFSGGADTTIRVLTLDNRTTDATEYTSLVTGQTLCYDLATPITLQLTPNEISLLEGVNNISTTGDKLTLTYRNGSVATLADLLDLEKKLTDEEPYGFIEHMSILDPAQRIEYIGKNKNYSPMTINLAGDHLANYNEWYDFPVIKENKPYMIKADGTVDYALDPNDYTKKFDGSASDVANTSYTGGAFAWIPKTYKREFTVGDDRYVYISTKKLSDEYEAIGFIDENGLEHDGAWIPMFYGTEITQDGIVKIMTLATGAPTQNRNTDTQKTYLTNANPDTLFFGGAIVKVLTDIMIMLGKNSDVQAVFGTGNMSGGNGAQYMKNNACIDGGAFYGTTTNNVLNKAFHSLVLLTQNQWQRDPYTLNIQGEYVVSPYYKYDLTGDSYVKTGVFVTPPSSNNWVYPHKSVSVPHWGAEPVGPYSGSTTTGWADGQYTLANQLTDTTVRVVRRFASCVNGRGGGLRAVSLTNAASDTGWGIGASPLLLSKGTAPQ